MQPIAILSSICSGHDGFPPRPSVTGVPLFTVNGFPVMATGGIFIPHVKPDNPPHPGIAIGSSKLTINGQPAVMVGDVISCGSVVATGQPLMTIS
ncbi:PAAR domain-containing protein [Photobacterium sp. CCB-ST2H9]|uniref:PAAR domain-containing protein n=1 Tax=Photobacterium sp. CCB-ST2H9 TaxID=2912855 RepID=UPI003531E7F5